MRAAVISDIHGNNVALQTVLAEIEQSHVDRLICLGDVAGTGPQPAEVVDRLQALNCPVVMGNVDQLLLEQQREPGADGDQRRFEDIDLWCAQQLRPAQLDFLRSFQPTVSLSLDAGVTLLGFHGSPRSNKEVIEATTPVTTLDEILKDSRATILAGGHTHVQLLRRYQDSFILNPGSVGLPFEVSPKGAYSPSWAEYALIEITSAGLRIELRRVSYDIKPLLEAAHSSGMPHADWWSKDWSAGL